LDGERAGFINSEFDLEFMDSLTEDPVWATGYSTQELAELTGTQGVELMMWLAARATLLGDARAVTASYHLPISNNASGLMLLERAGYRGLRRPRPGAACGVPVRSFPSRGVGFKFTLRTVDGGVPMHVRSASRPFLTSALIAGAAVLPAIALPATASAGRPHY